MRKQLGVWYTPAEIVKYTVERVDTVLRQELSLPLGLADKNVYVLDPCCGTGSYLVEVLDRIHRTLKERGDYHAIVRANRYKDKPHSTQLATEVFKWTEQEKTETPAVFTFRVSRIAQRVRRTERPIEDIKKDAKLAVAKLCREILDILETKPIKTAN